MIEAALTPSIGEGGIALSIEVQKMDADGSLGELLRSGALGDSMREKVAAAVESAVRKAPGASKARGFPTAAPAGCGSP